MERASSTLFWVPAPILSGDTTTWAFAYSSAKLGIKPVILTESDANASTLDTGRCPAITNSALGTLFKILGQISSTK